MPVTTPDAEPTVATDVLDELQEPPVVVDDSVVVLPMHIVSDPVIAAGIFSTESENVREQPVANV